MRQQITGRIVICFVCGALLTIAFKVVAELAVEPCEECWPGEVPAFVYLLALIVLPVLGLLIYLNNEEWVYQLTRFSLTALGPQPRDLRIETAGNTFRPAQHEASRSLWWSELNVWIGSLLLASGLALYLGGRHWVATHTFVAFDAPVSFTGGHIRTGNFYVNLKAEYTIEIYVNGTHLKQAVCQNGWARGTGVHTHWNLYEDNRLLDRVLKLEDVLVERYMYYPEAFWVSGTAESYSLHANFPAHPGNYSLDVEVLSHSACFDMGKPRVRITTSSDSYTLAQAAAVMLGTIGTTMLLLSLAPVKGSTEKQVGLVLCGNVSGRGYFAATTPSRAVFSKLPPFGLFVGLLLIPLAVFLPLMYPKGSIGIPIYVSAARVASPTASDPAPLILRLKFNGDDSAPSVYLNSDPVPLAELGFKLKDELEYEPMRTIYIQSDDDVAFQDIVTAIDMARTWKAKIVLIPSGPQTH